MASKAHVPDASVMTGELFEELNRPGSLVGIIGQDHIVSKLLPEIKSANDIIGKLRKIDAARSKLLSKKASIYSEVNKMDGDDKEKEKILSEVNPIDEKIQKINSVISKLKSFRIRHQIFLGPVGTGKTSGALAMSKDIYGKDAINHTFYFNASDNRGIEFVRGKLKELSCRSSGVFPFNIIILDEVDNMTSDAQDDLRVTIERSVSAVFILIGNYPEKIKAPVTSRCTPRKFRKIPIKTAVDYLDVLCKKYNIKYEEGFLEKFYLLQIGDMRSCVGILGELARIGGILNEETITEITVDKEAVKHFFELAISGKLSRAFIEYQKLCIDKSLTASESLNLIARYVMSIDWSDPDEEKKALFKARVFNYAKEFKKMPGDDSDVDGMAIIGKIFLAWKGYEN